MVDWTISRHFLTYAVTRKSNWRWLRHITRALNVLIWDLIGYWIICAFCLRISPFSRGKTNNAVRHGKKGNSAFFLACRTGVYEPSEVNAAFRAKCRVRLAWLRKRLLCRLPPSLPSPCTASHQAISFNAFRWRSLEERTREKNSLGTSDPKRTGRAE